jgi:hypothetical protein
LPEVRGDNQGRGHQVPILWSGSLACCYSLVSAVIRHPLAYQARNVPGGAPFWGSPQRAC